MQYAITYDQAILGLLLAGARADGMFQHREKEIIIKLTTEIHPIAPTEYKFIIDLARELDPALFEELILQVLQKYATDAGLEALYWLLIILEVDIVYTQPAHSDHDELLYRVAEALQIDWEDMYLYKQKRDKELDFRS
ncbi:MAG: hypothetical protein EAZ55_13265 [Cytophagales bacterium]|nr:MAG: hypothetical protein EAZ55_13265 [Cytophagales bacterium]